MKASLDLHPRWSTQWAGTDIVVLRNDAEIDRVAAPAIRRIVFVQPPDTTSAGDAAFALVELDDEFIVFPAATGLAGRVHFERQSFWAAKACVYWVDDANVARLPVACTARRGLMLGRREPRYVRVPREELAGVVEHWPLEGPQSWDDRRWQRIERSRPFSRTDSRLPVGAARAGHPPR
ncbi:MAG TPA: hypothetical protein VLI72_09060 [Methylibium sp.]|nr:hypothetical protein [Methylibium sp.]